MFKTLFLMYEMLPSTQIKRMMQKIKAMQEGQKIRKKAERELNKLVRPKYELPKHLN